MFPGAIHKPQREALGTSDSGGNTMLTSTLSARTTEFYSSFTAVDIIISMMMTSMSLGWVGGSFLF